MKCMLVFGTRPEAIKMAPVITALKNDPAFEVVVVVTGQHREMLDQVLEIFDIFPDVDLNVMSASSSLEETVSNILLRLSREFDRFKPDIVLVHGDTATTLAASLGAYFKKLKIGHIEAGLRTFNLYSPWPEEGNRKLVASLANLHFAPTDQSKKNLLKEGIPEEKIIVTGNTVIDALFETIEKIKSNDNLEKYLGSNFPTINLKNRIILVTGHRRENFGRGLEAICDALEQIASQQKDVDIIYPLHLNPNVRVPVQNRIGHLDNIHLIEPLDYLLFIELMSKAYLILTDSGGIQEEAPSLNIPVLLMRDTTERPEGVEGGTVRLVGTNTTTIVQEVNALLNDEAYYESISAIENPFGCGDAASKIKASLLKFSMDGI